MIKIYLDINKILNMSQNPKVITSYCTNGLIKIFKKRLPFSVKVNEEITKAHP